MGADKNAEVPTMIDRSFEAAPPIFFALNVIVYVPAAAGVPESFPAVVIVIPNGRSPLTMSQVMGEVPDAESDASYAKPASPAGSEEVEIEGL